MRAGSRALQSPGTCKHGWDALRYPLRVFPAHSGFIWNGAELDGAFLKTSGTSNRRLGARQRQALWRQRL